MNVNRASANQNQSNNYNRQLMLKLLIGGAALSYVANNIEHKRAECIQFSDKHIEKCLSQIENGIKELQFQH